MSVLFFSRSKHVISRSRSSCWFFWTRSWNSSLFNHQLNCSSIPHASLLSAHWILSSNNSLIHYMYKMGRQLLIGLDSTQGFKVLNIWLFLMQYCWNHWLLFLTNKYFSPNNISTCLFFWHTIFERDTRPTFFFPSMAVKRIRSPVSRQLWLLPLLSSAFLRHAHAHIYMYAQTCMYMYIYTYVHKSDVYTSL